MDIKEKLLAKMPEHLFKFLDTLTGNELNDMQKLDPRLIAKIYQAGAIFAVDATIEIKNEAN